MEFNFSSISCIDLVHRFRASISCIDLVYQSDIKILCMPILARIIRVIVHAIFCISNSIGMIPRFASQMIIPNHKINRYEIVYPNTNQ